jgi:ABC-2 type transport system ATP-binding protein
MFNLDKELIREKYEELTHRFGLENHLKKKVKTFSGGMKRKVNLILGLLHNPKILVLDEPIVGIDVRSKVEILNYLNEIHQQGITIIYTSHQMNESQSFCENFTLLDCGKNLITGNLEEVLKHQGKTDLESILLDLK